jgi:hypothetical protein
MMWLRPTEPYLSSCPNGPSSSSTCKQMINLLSMFATILGSHQQEGSMEWLWTLAQTYFEAVALALWPNGLTITSFSGSHRCLCQSTMHDERSGTMTYRYMEGTGKMEVGYGTEGETCQMDLQKSLMRTVAHSLLTWLMPLPVLQKTTSLPMLMQIDKISSHLGIQWEPSKSIPFGTEVLYLGFCWDLCACVVHLLDEKRVKYLAAIAEWEKERMHNLLDTQKLYRKLLHSV